MFKFLNEVNNLSLFYKIKHLSHFMKGMGVLYLLVFIGFSFLFFQPSIESSNPILNWVFITLIGVIFSITFLSSVSEDYSFFHSYLATQKLSDIEYDLIMKLKLYRHSNMKDIFKDIDESLKNDEILTSKEVTNYVNLLRSRHDINEMNEAWFLATYDRVIAKKREIFKINRAPS